MNIPEKIRYIGVKLYTQKCVKYIFDKVENHDFDA